MLKLRKSFTYVENFTLTGKKLLAGDYDTNTYIYVKKEAVDLFRQVIDKINIGTINCIDDLDIQLRPIAKQLDAKGFFETSEKPKGSFNELNSFSKIIYKKDFARKPKDNKNYYLANYLFLILLVVMVAFVLNNNNYLEQHLDISSLSIVTIIISIFIIPIFVFFFHELGHYIVAQILGISVATFQIGFFISYPTIYLTYRGINLNSSLKKISILLGGITGHITGLVIGIILMRNNINNILLDIWMLGNTSMIFVNLSVFGVTDGYYILTTLLGIYNLRLLGYSAIKKIMHRIRPVKKEIVSGLCLLTLWILSFFGVFKSIKINTTYIGIPQDIIDIFSLVFIVFLIIRFVYKTYKLKI